MGSRGFVLVEILAVLVLLGLALGLALEAFATGQRALAALEARSRQLREALSRMVASELALVAPRRELPLPAPWAVRPEDGERPAYP